MAINIKEILHPSDSDSIKFEKINYNFDQILINGGGPQGIQGTKGQQGADGATGIKGEKGEIGQTGLKGDTGISDTPWATIANTNNSISSSSILKPKIGANDIGSSIWLGDPNFNEGTSVNGIEAVDARINVQRTANTYDHFVSYVSSNVDRINFTYEVLNTVPTYGFKKDFTAASTVLGYQIQTDNISLKADGILELNSGPLKLAMDHVAGNLRIYETSVSGTNVKIEIPSIFESHSRWTSTKSIGLPVGTTAERTADTLIGQIRFNSDINQFEGRDSAGWKGLGGLIDADQDTYITAEQFPDEDILRFNVGEPSVVGGIQVASMGNTLIEGINTFSLVSTFNTKIEAKDDVIINNYGSGLVFKTGDAGTASGEADAPNEGTPISHRSMDDYFHQSQSTSDFGRSLADNTPWAASTAPASRVLSTTDWKYSNNTFRIHRKTDGGTGQQTVAAQQLRMIIRPGNCKFGYVKVGHMVTAWGCIEYFPGVIATDQFSGGINADGEFSSESTSATPTQVVNHKKARVAIFPSAPSDSEVAGGSGGTGGYFPYKSSLSKWTYFPIAIKLEGWDDLTETTPNPVNQYEYWGAIPPGGNYFNIARIAAASTQIASYTDETPGTSNAAQIQTNFMNVEDFIWDTGSFGYSVHLNYKFSIPTDDKSYETFIASDKITTYTEAGQSFVLPPTPPGGLVFAGVPATITGSTGSTAGTSGSTGSTGTTTTGTTGTTTTSPTTTTPTTTASE